jgi:hypothetical protein
MNKPIILSIKDNFSNIEFEPFEIKHGEHLCTDIDFLGWVGSKAFGIQIRLSEKKRDSIYNWYKQSFNEFTMKYGGNVFVLYKINDTIKNEDVIEEIRREIVKLSS